MSSDDIRTVRLSVPDMDCPSCAGKVTSSVERLDGIDDIDAAATTGTLTVSYDSTQTDSDSVRERVEAAGYAIESDTRTERFGVPEMDCPSCAGKVESALDLAGVEAIDTRPTTGEVVVTYDPEAIDRDSLGQSIESSGYEVTSTTTDDSGPDLSLIHI